MRNRLSVIAMIIVMMVASPCSAYELLFSDYYLGGYVGHVMDMPDEELEFYAPSILSGGEEIRIDSDVNAGMAMFAMTFGFTAMSDFSIEGELQFYYHYSDVTVEGVDDLAQKDLLRSAVDLAGGFVNLYYHCTLRRTMLGYKDHPMGFYLGIGGGVLNAFHAVLDYHTDIGGSAYVRQKYKGGEGSALAAKVRFGLVFDMAPGAQFVVGMEWLGTNNMEINFSSPQPEAYGMFDPSCITLEFGGRVFIW